MEELIGHVLPVDDAVKLVEEYFQWRKQKEQEKCTDT